MIQTAKKAKKFNEAYLIALLAKKHPAPSWAFFSHVRNGTGDFIPARTADAMAMSLWPSRGLELHGFEVKVHRSDWLKELKSPEKAEEIANFCHRWWIVAPEDVVEAAELPPKWGLMTPKNRGLRITKAAEDKQAKPPTFLFLASILRKASESMMPRESIKNELERRFDEGVKSGEARSDCNKNEVEKLRRMVKEFEAASGVRMSPWNAGEVGRAVEYLLSRGVDTVRREAEGARNLMARQIERLDKVIQEMKDGGDDGAK